MSIFKCKMCGGTIEFEQGATVGVCDSCRTKQTLPRLDDDRRANLYDRANHFRRANEFDKASGIYEQILNEDTSDAEAYWSLVLCRYGVEYVEDPATRKRVPTVNRAQFTSIFDDDNYKSALQYADTYQRALYEEEANAINEIQKGILAISQKEEPFDVFICYKETDNNGRRTPDSVLANDLYHQLTNEGFKVFFSRITLEDKLGTAYEPYIFAALNSAKVMVVLGTRAEYFNAVWVKNEWSRYLALVKTSGGKKVLIPAYRDMDPYDLPEEFSHLQAQDMSKLGFMQDLIRGIKKITEADAPKETVRETVVVNQANANTAPLLKRAFMYLEDGNWTEADAYCERVLDQDPENAEAYLGKLMAEKHARKQEDLLDCGSPYLSQNNNFRKAVKFGDKQLSETLNSYPALILQRIEETRKNTVYSDAVNAMSVAKTEKAYKDAAEAFKSIPGFKDSDVRAENCLSYAEDCRMNVIYLDGVKAMKNADDYVSLRAASQIFGRIPGYKDADELAEQCLNLAESRQKDTIYENARSQMKGASTSGYEAAIKAFQMIPGWKDADEQIYVCQRKIEEIKAKEEVERHERERKEAQKRIAAEKAEKKRKKIAAIVTSIIVAGIILAIVMIKVIIPNCKYYAAVDLYKKGKYDEAITALDALDGYRDSREVIEKCKTMIKETKYNNALDLYKAGKYDEAITILKTLGGYKDSGVVIEKYKMMIKETNYSAALDLYKAEKYDEAIIALQALDGYKDSSEIIEKCETAIKEIKYNAALDLYKAEKYDEAIIALQALDGYRDSSEIIEKCETAIKEIKYNAALSLYKAGKYDEAITAFTALNGYKDSEEKVKKALVNSKIEKIRTAVAGDIVLFGSYEQDNDTSNGKENIEWIVLAKEGNKALVISKYALDCQKYHTSHEKTTWETCTLRRWLNETFLSSAFNSVEQSKVISSPVTSEKRKNNPFGLGDLEFTILYDKLFLLSDSENEEYFSSTSSRQCQGTAYCYAQGAYKAGNGCCEWWLRTPGASHVAAYSVNSRGYTNAELWVENAIAVRPALWIDLGAID